VQCVTDGTGAITLDISQLPLPFHQPNGPQLTISLAGLSSFFDFDILAPYSEPSLAYTLGNTIGLGNCTSSTSPECQPLQIVISSSSSSSSSRSSQSSSISISLENLAVSLDLLAKLNLNSFFDLQVGQVGVKGCIVSSFEALQISTLNASLSSASVEINKGTERSRVITNGVSFVLNFLTNSLKLAQLNEQIAAQLSQSSEVCANGGVMPSGSGDTSSHLPPWEWQLSLIVVSGVIALGILSASYYFYGRTGTKTQLRAIFGKFSLLGAGEQVKMKKKQKRSWLATATSSLVRTTNGMRRTFPVGSHSQQRQSSRYSEIRGFHSGYASCSRCAFLSTSPCSLTRTPLRMLWLSLLQQATALSRRRKSTSLSLRLAAPCKTCGVY